MMFKKEIWRRPAWFAALVSFIFGVVAHLFGLVNAISNYDDIVMQPSGYGTGVTSGRWFLTVLGDWGKELFGNYNVPMFNGVVFIFLISVATGLLVSAFGIKSRLHAAVAGMTFVVFPTAVSILFFKFTAIYYGVAVLLAVAAAWVLPRYKLGGLLLSALFTALNLGIYQAYMPLTVAILVLMLIRHALTEDLSFLRLLGKGLYACAGIMLGLVFYFLFLKGALLYYGKELSAYQGISSMGSISIVRIPALVWEAFKSFCKMPFADYCDLAQLKVIKDCYLLLGVLCGAMILYCMIRSRKKIGIIVLIVLMCAAFPVASNLIMIMCPDSDIYTLMVYGFAVIFWVPVTLYEAVPHDDGRLKRVKPILSKVIVTVLAVMILSYTYLANVNYVSLFYANRQTENYLNAMITRVRMTEGYTVDKKLALVGRIRDPRLVNSWSGVPTYGGNATVYNLVNSYSRFRWYSTYLGSYISEASEEDIALIRETEEFQNMPYWPDNGSVKAIDNFMVIKFPES